MRARPILSLMTERAISSAMLPRRSQAIALSQETESTGVQGSISYEEFCSPSTTYSNDAVAPEWSAR